MINEVPMYVNVVFIAATFFAVYLFYEGTGRSKITLALIAAWLLVQMVLGFSGFYKVTDTFPPRFILLGLPPMVLIVSMFLTTGGNAFIKNLNLEYLTYMHTVRVPIEIVLLWLFIYGQIPQVMTFQGWNFDILAGLTAPILGYLVFRKKLLGKKALLAWNIISLVLLITIITIAVLSAPVSFQQFGFEQPNTAVLNFPFVWLPSCIVPIVLFSQVATIKRLLHSNGSLVG